MIKLPLVARLKFFVERQFVKGALYQLLVVVALVAITALLGGLLIVGTDSENIAEAVWWAFLRLTDPGYLGDDEGTWRRVVSTLLTVAGYVLFMGTLIAILTRSLIARMQELEQGLTPVAVRNHIVIIGWTNRTVPILRELLTSVRRVRNFLQAHGAPRLRLAVLADEVTPERTKELRHDPISGRHLRNIILRSGSELNAEHLRRVACTTAAAIIVPGRAFEPGTQVSSDVETVKVLLSLDAMVSRAGQQTEEAFPYVVAEIQEGEMLNVARRAYRGPLELISGDTVIGRLIVQNVRHGGLSVVFNELLSHREGNEFFIYPAVSALAPTLGEARAWFPGAVLCGVVRPHNDGWQPALNLPDSYPFADDDHLVLIAHDHDQAMPEARPMALPSTGTATAGSQPPAQPRQPLQRRRRVLVLGWSRKVPALAHEFASYRDTEVELTLVSTYSARARQQQLDRVDLSGLARPCTLLEADYSVEAELRELDPGQYDCVILLSTDRVRSGEEADARAMVAYLLLEEVLADSVRSPQVILELSDPHNELLMGHRYGEIIISPMLLSHLLAQVALRPELRSVIEALFTAGSAEIDFRPADAYGWLDADVSFAELSVLAQQAGETALGVYRSGPTPKAPRQLELNPPRNKPLALSVDDQLVVLADYN